MYLCLYTLMHIQNSSISIAIQLFQEHLKTLKDFRIVCFLSVNSSIGTTLKSLNNCFAYCSLGFKTTFNTEGSIYKLSMLQLQSIETKFSLLHIVQKCSNYRKRKLLWHVNYKYPEMFILVIFSLYRIMRSSYSNDFKTLRGKNL